MAEDQSDVKDLVTSANPDDIIPDHVKKHPDWILSKVLFEKFGMLHSFHVYQLKCYMIACCGISIGGQVKIDADNHAVLFDLYTDKNYRILNGGPVKRGKFSWHRLFGISNKTYNSEVKSAKFNLRTWTRRLLWTNTDVQVTIDGVKYG